MSKDFITGFIMGILTTIVVGVVANKIIVMFF